MHQAFLHRIMGNQNYLKGNGQMEGVMSLCCRAQLSEKCLSVSYPLSLANEGEWVKIVQLRGGGLFKERLLSMGIDLEDKILVIRRQHGGAVLIEKSGSRYALGGGMAHKINVIRV